MLTINNPPHNYLPTSFFNDLYETCELMTSSDVDAVILTGKGKVFSKGADLAEINSKHQAPDLDTLLQGNELFTFVSRLNKPVIAAINGACLGGGLELALSCHIRICSQKARLGLPEVSIGFIPGLGGIQRLIRVVGESKALEMILLGDIISASQALDLNLVSRVFPKDNFLPRVFVFVKTLLSTRREAIEEVLKLFVKSRPESESRNIHSAAESFLRMIEIRNA